MGRHTSTAILANERWGVPRSGTVAQFRYTGFWRMSRNPIRGSDLGTWAGTQAQQFWQMKDGESQDQAQWHNLDILDFGG